VQGRGPAAVSPMTHAHRPGIRVRPLLQSSLCEPSHWTAVQALVRGFSRGLLGFFCHDYFAWGLRGCLRSLLVSTRCAFVPATHSSTMQAANSSFWFACGANGVAEETEIVLSRCDENEWRRSKQRAVRQVPRSGHGPHTQVIPSSGLQRKACAVFLASVHDSF
jgi:hypothetical protein